MVNFGRSCTIGSAQGAAKRRQFGFDREQSRARRIGDGCHRCSFVSGDAAIWASRRSWGLAERRSDREQRHSLRSPLWCYRGTRAPPSRATSESASVPCTSKEKESFCTPRPCSGTVCARWRESGDRYGSKRSVSCLRLRVMKLLESSRFEAVNSALSIQTGDCAISGRIESYSCKLAGQDKALYKRLTANGGTPHDLQALSPSPSTHSYRWVLFLSLYCAVLRCSISYHCAQKPLHARSYVA